jgi:hypothetical protein
MTTRNIGAILNVSRYLGSIFLDLSFTFRLENASSLQTYKSPHTFIFLDRGLLSSPLILARICCPSITKSIRVKGTLRPTGLDFVEHIHAGCDQLKSIIRRAGHSMVKNQLLTAMHQSNNHNEQRRRYWLMKSHGKH